MKKIMLILFVCFFAGTIYAGINKKSEIKVNEVLISQNSYTGIGTSILAFEKWDMELLSLDVFCLFENYGLETQPKAFPFLMLKLRLNSLFTKTPDLKHVEFGALVMQNLYKLKSNPTVGIFVGATF